MSTRKYLKTIAAAALLSLTTGVPTTADEPETMDFRKKQWQDTLDEAKTLPISRMNSNPMESLNRFGGDCTVQILYDPKKDWALKFRFMKGDKEAVAIEGHKASVFGAWKNSVYFVQNPVTDCGATVIAYDLETGKQLWKTPLKAIGFHDHFGYYNYVSMSLTSHPTRKQGEIIIEGNETFGSYLEVLDLETGQKLAHRAFKQKDIPKREDSKEERSGSRPIQGHDN